MAYRKMTSQRHRDLFDRYLHLYEVERRRFDDCVQILMDEFYYATNQTVLRVIREESSRRAEEKKKAQEEKESPGQ